MRSHLYALNVEWTGNTGAGTSGYKNYNRSYDVSVEGKEVIKGSSDPAFLGEKDKFNPEELLLASISSCHMLWYLHLCADAGVTVVAYRDHAKGIMIETANGGGKFESVTLFPSVTVSDASMIEKASKLHAKANAMCFIANSMNFPVLHEASCKISEKI